MFVVRGIAVSFSVFVMVYCALSIGVSRCWRVILGQIQHFPIRRGADLLFVLRMFPLIAATLITAAFTVPSFLLLEPRTIQEPVGEIPLVLGICGAVLGIAGIVNAVRASRRASRAIFAWTRKSEQVERCGRVAILRISQAVPAMTAAGIVRPKVLLSNVAEFLLTPNELQTALKHELAHVRRWDNLKKLLLQFVVFPGMAGLEAAWLESTEMAADDAAVASVRDALDLAAALLKLSRFTPEGPMVNVTAALVHSPASAMNARIERLITWSDERLAPFHHFVSWYGLGAILSTTALFAVTYSQLLVRVHTATEWLIR
jgi:beta-lactamase regulating signal transducer with metallopeptidase domain